MSASPAVSQRPRPPLLPGPLRSMNTAAPARYKPGGGSRRGGGGGLRHALLTLGLLVVSLSVVGMHQLSLGHDFAAPSTGTQQPAAQHHPEHTDQVEGPVHARTAPHSPAGAHSVAIGITTADSPVSGVAAISISDGTSSDDSGCRGCGQHTMAFSACLLALTLLVLAWMLVRPRVLQLPPRMLWRLTTVVTFVARRVPALSLVELSVLRT